MFDSDISYETTGQTQVIECIPDSVITDTTEIPPITCDIFNQILHIITPRNTRNAIEISLPSSVPPDALISAISPALKKTMDSSHIEILEVTQREPESGDEPDKTSYIVIFLIIPNEIINNLRGLGVKNCIFYVGLSENKREFPVMAEAPELHRIAHLNREGQPSPYKSEIITLS